MNSSLVRYHVLVRLLVLSDIHANYPALDAVLNDAQSRSFDRVIHLGDALGYGPHPVEVVTALRDLGATCILGNHEHTMLTYVDNRRTSQDKELALPLTWQLSQLSKLDLALIRSWPDGVDDSPLGARYRHGTPVSMDTYTDSVNAARDAFARWQGRLGFVGHTHTPAAYATLKGPVGDWVKVRTFPEGGSYQVPRGARVILNPGSVGQPRDGNPHASYGIYDSVSEVFEVFRVPYPVALTQKAMREVGLPERLAARLALGQ
ncbi:metallophosphoesterase family protein [Deinococcus hopiensis]|uniref:metallophosphoesterase family protein n=1 Tax=Deinococcus hopiensis TaxID=309885 RepID=UPI001FEA3ED1|nr:metallophosphoesterase family protein [Deinococcus hopiensis]